MFALLLGAGGDLSRPRRSRGDSDPAGLRHGVGIDRRRPGDAEILVTACGRPCLYRKKINLSPVFAGETIGIKEVDDGVWLVSFMHYDLGYFALEQRTLQPLDNPFGPKLSPMS